MSGFRKGLHAQRRVLVRLGFWEAGFGLLFGATFSSRLCCLRLLLTPCQYLVAQVRWLEKNEGPGLFVIMRQKEAVENSSTSVCSTSQASFVVPTGYVEVDGWLSKLREQKLRSEDRERLNSYMTGELSIRKNIRAVARVMPYGKGKDVILTIPDWDIHSINDWRSTIPNFGDLSGKYRVPGDLGVWRRDTHAADKMRMHTHTRSHTSVL